MSLSIALYNEKAGAGCPNTHPMLDGRDCVGGELTRRRLWGSKALQELGSTYLTQLAARDLFVPVDELAGFRAECVMLLGEVCFIAAETEYDVEYVSERLRTVLAGIDEAQRSELGVRIA